MIPRGALTSQKMIGDRWSCRTGVDPEGRHTAGRVLVHGYPISLSTSCETLSLYSSVNLRVRLEITSNVPCGADIQREGFVEGLS